MERINSSGRAIAGNRSSAALETCLMPDVMIKHTVSSVTAGITCDGYQTISRNKIFPVTVGFVYRILRFFDGIIRPLCRDDDCPVVSAAVSFEPVLQSIDQRTVSPALLTVGDQGDPVLFQAFQQCCRLFTFVRAVMRKLQNVVMVFGNIILIIFQQLFDAVSLQVTGK